MNAWEQFKHWKSVRRDLWAALDMLDDEQLEFSPREGLRTLRDVACHIGNAEEGWFNYVVHRKMDEWPRYDPVNYPTMEAIKRYVDDVHQETIEYLQSLDTAGLETTVTAPWGDDFQLRWIVWHILEHEIHHRGEIYLMLGLLGLEGPDI
jgi:uncharacterized damage-inducible protein DinB